MSVGCFYITICSQDNSGTMRRQGTMSNASGAVAAENYVPSGSSNKANIAANSPSSDSLASLKQSSGIPLKPNHQRRRPALGDITNSYVNKPISRIHKVNAPRLAPRDPDGLIEDPECIPLPSSPVRPPSPLLDVTIEIGQLPPSRSPDSLISLPPLADAAPRNMKQVVYQFDDLSENSLSPQLKLFSVDELIALDDEEFLLEA